MPFQLSREPRTSHLTSHPHWGVVCPTGPGCGSLCCPLYSPIIKTQHARSRSEAVSLYKRNQRNGPVSILLGHTQVRLTTPGAEVWVVGVSLQGRNTAQAWGLASTPAGSPRRARTDTRTLGNQERYAQGQEGTESWDEPLTTEPPAPRFLRGREVGGRGLGLKPSTPAVPREPRVLTGRPAFCIWEVGTTVLQEAVTRIKEMNRDTYQNTQHRAWHIEMSNK